MPNFPFFNTTRIRWFNCNAAIFGIAVALIIGLQSWAFQNRLILILYCVATVGSAFLLVRRQALALAVAAVTLAVACMFAHVYYATAGETGHSTSNWLRDITGLATLFYITSRLLLESYRLQRAEQQREYQQRMEAQMVAMRAEALRKTSHEVRTPLATITAISETLMDGSTGELNDVQKEFVHDIDEAAKHLLGLVNDILDYAKAESRMLQIVPEKISLVESVQQCVSMIQPRASKAEVTVTAQIDPETSEMVADPLRLRQILLNLLSNAIKFNCQGGTVQIRVERDSSDWICLQVKDSGRGIAQEHLAHVFEPYYQAALADQGIGTGLGMAIVKHLVELHGGRIQIESKVGLGTTVSVTMPLIATPEVVSKDQLTKEKKPVVLTSLPSPEHASPHEQV